ncbi:HNH endonuclease signature motif containing protein [Gordonia sp. 852002-10350_SCH5691597]|uniref:HNH endonuclease signature motif containing protein n=1 Tax=Gordonia sp. 852002-10350_SCH5691597 TaxID=1834085 RepID=UPI0009EEF490|nr:HNH endonuclease signature motif containing protein [Gordonia sp. 852002-10350_SCH5691597]
MNSNSKPSDGGTGGAPSALGSSALASAALASAAVGSADAVVAEKLSRLAAVLDELATVDVSLVSDDVLVEATVEAERLALRTAGAVTDRLIVEASDRDLPHGLGFRDIRNFMGQRLHIGDPAARYRVIAATGTFTTICGDRLPPACPTLAGYVVEGRVAGAHVRAVLEVLEAIPGEVSAETKAAAEAQMAGYAVQFTPAEITNLGSRLLAHLDPDGTLTNPKDRKRRRRLWVNRQNAQLMSRLTADLDPIARARLDTVLDSWAKPGMNNPDDPDSPVGPITTANAEQVAAALRDQRSPAQRNHDAFSALLGQVLESGMLGNTHRGLPIQVIVTTSLHELEAQAGIAQTTSGTLLPIQDVIEMAASAGASQYLAVFGDHTSIPLYLGRSKRIASLGQRLASFASPGGKMCSAPGCNQPASRVQMHHAAKDWADGGLTDIDQLVPACDVHNRRVGPKPGQFTTRMITEGPDTGRVAWRLNAKPGMPENPERINRIADVKADFHDYLTAEHISNEAAAAARAAGVGATVTEIGARASDTADTEVGARASGSADAEMVVADAVGAWMMSPPSTPGAPSVNEPTLTGVELALVGALPLSDTVRLSGRVDIQWNLTDPPDPEPPTDPDAPTGPAPPASPWWLGGVDPPGDVDPPLSDAA